MNLEQFYKENKHKHLKKIQRILYMDKDGAEDVVQEAYKKAFESLDKYDPKRASFSTWFNYILYSTLRQVQRDFQRRPTTIELTEGLVYSSTPRSSKDEIEEVIDTSSLNEAHQEVVYLFYVLGFNNKDVATITGMSPTNVTTICNRFKREVSDG